MPLSPDAIVTIRGWVGSEPADSTLNTLYDQYLNHDEVVVYILRSRIAELSLEPSSVTVPGLSISHGSDLQAAQDALKNFMSSGGTGLEVTAYGVGTGKLTRKYPR